MLNNNNNSDNKQENEEIQRRMSANVTNEKL